MPLPPDIARVLEEYRKLGEAARRGLFVAERRTRKEIEEAARHALAIEAASRGADALRPGRARRGGA